MFHLSSFFRHGGLAYICCVQCGLEENSNTNMDLQDEVMQLDRVLLDMGLQRKLVPPDGWCLVSSWIQGMRAVGRRYPGSAEDLVRAACEELKADPFGYQLTGDYNADLNQYIYEKKFNSSAVDHNGFALAKITGIPAKVYLRDGKHNSPSYT